MPARRSLRYSAAHWREARGRRARSKVNTRLVTPPVEVMTTTISTCGWSAQHLDVADRRGVQRRRGDDREQVRHLRQRLGRRAHRLVDLAADELQVEAALAPGEREAALPVAEQAVDVEAVAGVGRDPPGARVRVGEQPVLLEHRELVAHGRGAGLDLGVGGERLRAHGHAGGRVGLDDLAKDQLLSRGQHRVRL